MKAEMTEKVMKLEMKETTLFRGDLFDATMEIKEVTEEGEFEGYGAIFNIVDQGGDVILPGAFTNSLESIPPQRVKMLWQHNPSEIIGKYTEIREDGRGLYCKGKIFTDLKRGAECHKLMREGAIEGLSIGYRAKEFSLSNSRDDEWRRKLSEVELREVSVVTFPMNEMAGIVAVKKSGELPTEREFERWLVRDAGLSARDAKVVISRGYKSLQDVRDAGSGDDEVGLAEALDRAAALFK